MKLSYKQLVTQNKQLKAALREIEARRLQLNPVHFDSQHECGRFMQFVSQTIKNLGIKIS